jgi:glyoxylase-like metal-dependent hydrolase (beta-lactamase superfamily II)
MQIYTLDLEFQGVPQTIAAFLVEGPGGHILVECGPGSTLPALKAQLAEHGLSPADIDAVIVTHIHFDHAGSAGWWTHQGVPLYVHHLGAPHLIDPSRLLASASRIYGDQMESLWGDIVAADADKVISLYDGDVIVAGGLTFTAMETQGHARHHHTIVVENIAFTGDAAGIEIGDGWVDIPAPPPEFDLETWRVTVRKLQQANFETLYATHFGEIQNPATHLEDFSAIMETVAAWIKQRMDEGFTRDSIVQLFREWKQNQAEHAGLSVQRYHQYEVANPHHMTVDGVMRYWSKRQDARTE